ncbi:MAG: FtsX-like permease family protein [Mucilaginibacter sp.]|nr:FtsX-like permease family protein [Mucilaginibacter sp.]
MIRNYLKSTIRNIMRNKFISFINIFGLTVGLTCCLLILSYIINEKSYDLFNTNAKNIYRVTRTFYAADGTASLHTGSVAPPFGPLLKNAFSDIEQMTRLWPTGSVTLKYGSKLFNEKEAFYAEKNLFSVFSIPVLKGDAKTALADPYSVMLTESMARKYFNGADPMNKTIQLNGNKREFKVTGIFKDLAPNSHFHPQLLLSFNTLNDTSVYGQIPLTTRFNHNSFFTYLLFPENYNVARIESQLPAFLDKYVHLNNLPGNTKTHQATKLDLQKLAEIHLYSHLDTEIEPNGDIKRIYIFSAIALFILLIACINYMNLSTARSILRAKEIGVRKVVGAQRKEIIGQFLSESILISYIALALAFAISILVAPVINKISGNNFSIDMLLQWMVLLPLFFLPFVIGLISGAYPALFMSSFVPVKILKGIFKVGSGNISFRKALVVTQFSISIILMVATAVVYQQLQYMQNKNLGYAKDNIITMDYGPGFVKQYEPFKADLLRDPAIKKIGKSSYIPSDRILSASDAAVMHNGSMQQVKIELKFVQADYDFNSTYDMHMAAGREFSKAYPTDTAAYIINEEAVKQLEWKTAENAIGRDISYGGVKGKVIGVVKDVQFESLHQKVIPLLFQLPRFDYFGKLSIKVDGHNVQTALAMISSVWKKYQPDTPFEFTFLDDKFAKLYNAEEQQGTLFTIFSCIAIFIACLGLLGLSAFTIGQRVKEIGLRKVLGASVPQIVATLSHDFLKLVIISALIAIPVAWYAMNTWLLDFAFRISISWWVLTMAGVIALIIAFATISFQSIKAALANPVNSLRSE